MGWRRIEDKNKQTNSEIEFVGWDKSYLEKEKRNSSNDNFI